MHGSEVPFPPEAEVTGMVSAKVLSKPELADLEKLVRKHRQGGK